MVWLLFALVLFFSSLFTSFNFYLSFFIRYHLRFATQSCDLEACRSNFVNDTFGPTKHHFSSIMRYLVVFLLVENETLAVECCIYKFMASRIFENGYALNGFEAKKRERNQLLRLTACKPSK